MATNGKEAFKIILNHLQELIENLDHSSIDPDSIKLKLEYNQKNEEARKFERTELLKAFPDRHILKGCHICDSTGCHEC